jgi:hypothetical protein
MTRWEQRAISREHDGEGYCDVHIHIALSE